ncbi:MAG: DNA-binding response regulator [Alphaproteobacteria bacterium HGW-Alphaproteobacteria-12]|nr:MAG: DNA-binding response regulator [Alphaproteobacteria bacterium HGW-Alphaproteobacteria-12]
MTTERTVFVVDDDEAVRDSLSVLLEAEGYAARAFGSARAFLDVCQPDQAGCLVADIRMPDMDGLALQEELVNRRIALPVIIVTGHGDVALAVRAMKAGAVDFIEKPFDGEALLDGVKRALELARKQKSRSARARDAAARTATLTLRERQVLEHLMAGRSNKMIAHELGISPRTIEIHRAHLMEKMQVRSLSDLVRTALEAEVTPAGTT